MGVIYNVIFWVFFLNEIKTFSSIGPVILNSLLKGELWVKGNI